MFEDLRHKITDLDEVIISLLARRFELTEQIGKIKKESRIEIEDPEREAELAEFYESCAKKEGIDPSIIAAVYETIFDESKKKQA